jgi:hypothetical protein
LRSHSHSYSYSHSRSHSDLHLYLHLHLYSHSHLQSYSHLHSYSYFILHISYYFNYWLINAICTKRFVIEAIRKWIENCQPILLHHVDKVKYVVPTLIQIIFSSKLEPGHPVRQTWQLLFPRCLFGFIGEQLSDDALRYMENLSECTSYSNVLVIKCDFFDLYNSWIYNIFIYSESILMNLQIVSNINLPIFMTNININININIEGFLMSEKNIETHIVNSFSVKFWMDSSWNHTDIIMESMNGMTRWILKTRYLYANC